MIIYGCASQIVISKWLSPLETRVVCDQSQGNEKDHSMTALIVGNHDWGKIGKSAAGGTRFRRH